MEEARTYSEGEWIVHSHFGVGQIQGIEVKGVSGDDTRYYKVQTADSTYWMPVDQLDSEILRPLSTPKEIQQAVDTLQKPPKEMSSNYKTRQGRIQQVQVRNTPRAIARLIRDLRARQRKKGPLNGAERSAFRALKQRLAEEWAIVSGRETEKVTSQLDELLNPDQASAQSQVRVETSQEVVSLNSSTSQRKSRKLGVWLKRRAKTNSPDQTSK